MRRLVLLLGLAGFLWWLLRRDRSPGETATIGYEDGSSVTLEPGAPELERLLAIGREAVGP
ncbi:MAG TPA: hypothetical protein VJ689_02205 [Gaiellaceae bacterium]|jgi:hypothetical protein|nr:hypothetical protein [Gaiellaceae bacterium]